MKNDKGDPTTNISRRGFVRIIGIGVVAPSVFAAACSSSKTAADASDVTTPPANYFPQSVASGDPLAESVILWTRVEDSGNSGDIPLKLTVATDAALTQVVATQNLLATAAHDHVIKLRVSGLSAKTLYYYRFDYEKSGTTHSSKVGRTKTAPTATDDTPVKFATANCQDFIGRYYNSYLLLSQVATDLDFFVHLGDYIYETTGDPSFQSAAEKGRSVAFSNNAEAMAFKNDQGQTTHYAAQSIGNYRDLYKAYRSDPMLQKVHELLPMIAIWDDHEFSDDCWGDEATYFDGKQPEKQTDRRVAAERAYWEYMPIDRGLDTAGTALEIGDKVPIKDSNVVLYRQLQYGKHLQLWATDTRTYRPDHAIAEDAFYARVVMTKDELTAASIDPNRKIGDTFEFPLYIDIDNATYAAHKPKVVEALSKRYQTEYQLTKADADAKAAVWVTKLLDVAAVNKLLEAAIAASEITKIDTAALTDRGMTYDNLHLSEASGGKGRIFAADGIHSRYLVEQTNYNTWRKSEYAKSKASQDVLGATQEAWLKDAVGKSTATWKVLASSISFTRMTLKLDKLPPSLENHPDKDNISIGRSFFQAAFPTEFLFSVDQWDGFPDKARELLDLLRKAGGGIVISGDIHSAYGSNHGKGAEANAVFEFTGPSIASETFKGFARGKVNSLLKPLLPDEPNPAGLPAFKAVIDNLEAFLRYANPDMTFASNSHQGVMTFEAKADELLATYHLIPEDQVSTSYYDKLAELEKLVLRKTFRVKDNAISDVTT